MKKTVEVWGGFHNVASIKLRVDAANIPERQTQNACWLEEPGILTEGQAKRLRRHMCGISGCWCGLQHGSQWAEV